MSTEYGQGYGLPAESGYPGHTEGRRHRLPAALRAPVEGRTWRELGYVLLSLPISVLLFTYAITMVSLLLQSSESAVLPKPEATARGLVRA